MYILLGNKLFNKTLNAVKIIAELRNQAPELQHWTSIEAQLNFIISDFSIAGNFLNQANAERVTKIIIGIQAVREIESTDPALAALLCEIDYEYKTLYATD
jgi:hypothetical protein